MRLTLTTTRAAAAILVAALGLGACTNERQGVTVVEVAKTLWQARKSPTAGPPDERIVAAETSRALQLTDGPLMLMRFERNGTVAVLRRIETNGAHETWTTWGRTERRSITTKKGVVTATRGLGWDLMSSSVDRLLAMVTGLNDGIDRQVLRHLDGENKIVETVADCAFTPDPERQRYEAGELSQVATRIDVFCRTETGGFSNYYLVGSSGRILQSHQWMGPDLGYATLWQLR